MKIVVLDGYTENPGDLSWAPLEALGELTVYDYSPKDDDAELIARIGDAEIVFTNATPVRGGVIEACPNLKFLGMLATGYNAVDGACARRRGVPLCNIPSYGTDAVAQFSIGLLLELCHRTAIHHRNVHEGAWEASALSCYGENPVIELSGKTMGIIGFGRIGRQTARIARAIGMRILAYGGTQTEEGRAIGTYVDLDTLLANADVISLHCPYFPATHGIINRETIAKMKDGVMLINTARGKLIVDQDLADALNSGKVYGAGLDVISVEPIAPDNPLLRARNCLITPHVAWAPRECRQRIMDTAAENLKAFLAGHPVNVVN